MIAVSSTPGKFITCKETQVEAYTVDGGIEIVIPATIDLAACLKSGVNSIDLEILKQNDQPNSTAKTIDQINTQLKLGAANNLAASRNATILASRHVDITTLIPNSVTRGRAFSGDTRSRISALLPTKTKVLPSQIETVTTRGDQIKGTDRQAADQLRDPAYQRMGEMPLDTVAAISATAFSARTRVNVLPVGAPTTRIVLADPTTSDTKLSVRYRGSSRDLTGSKARITVRANGTEAQVVTLRLPTIGSLLEITDLPSIAPIVTGNVGELGKGRITVTQQDRRANAVMVTYRPVKDYTQPVSGFSTLFENVHCPSGSTVALDIPVAEPAIVRVHPVRGDDISPVFGSVVLGKIRRGEDRFSSRSSSSLIAVNMATGISIDILTNEPQIEAALIRRFDLRTRTYTTLTSAPVLLSTIQNFVDEGVEDLTVVRYEADLYRSNGDVVRRAAVSEPIERIEPRDIVSAEITVNAVTDGNQMVKINIVPSVKQNDVNFLIDYIKALGLETAFQTDLEELRKSLLNCVKFDITRVDLQTGETKYVGQTSSSIDDDIDDVKVVSRFLYIFDAYVRSPSQLTDVIVDRANRPTGSSPKITKLGLHITKSDIDSANTKGTTELSQARRFFSRSNFETGTMPSQAAVDGFRDGRTGDIFTARVTVKPSLPAVTSVEVKTARNLPVILWKVSGNTQLIDRYVVTATSSGATWTVAPAGSVGTSASLQVTDTVSHSLPRYITYSVYPVYLDGRSGSTVSTGPVLVERMREV